MTSIFSHKKSFTRWVISVFTDYETVVTAFMRESGWDQLTFKNKLSECGTALLHHSAVGRGKVSEDQRLCMTKALLETARDWWLYYPLREFLDNIDNDDYSIPKPELLHRVKLMLTGFYLTYAMYKSQAYVTGKVKISMDSQDMMAFYYFKLCIVECAKIDQFLKKQIAYLLFDIISEDGFSSCADSMECGIDLRARLRRCVVGSKLFEFNMAVKDNLLSISLPDYADDITAKLKSLEVRKAKIIAKAMSGDAFMKLINNGGQDASEESPKMVHNDEPAGTSSNSLLPFVSRTRAIKEKLDSVDDTGLEDVLNAAVAINIAIDKPILTIQNILGNSSMDRTIQKEAAMRWTGLRLKSGDAAGKKPSKRKRLTRRKSAHASDVEVEPNQAKEVKKVRQIPANSQNLLTYIRNLPYSRVKETSDGTNTKEDK